MDTLTDDPLVDPGSFAYRDLIGRDKWSNWTPVSSGWTNVGTPVFTGRFRIVGRGAEFQIKVVPGTTIATTAGTSYIILPVTAQGLAGLATMMNLTTNIAVGVCVVDVPNSRIYLPSQIASGNTFLIAGWNEV